MVTFDEHLASETQLLLENVEKSRKLCLFTDILLQLFDAMISPISLFESEVWGYENSDIIESLYLEFCKYMYIIKVKKCTPNCNLEEYSTARIVVLGE